MHQVISCVRSGKPTTACKEVGTGPQTPVSNNHSLLKLSVLIFGKDPALPQLLGTVPVSAEFESSVKVISFWKPSEPHAGGRGPTRAPAGRPTVIKGSSRKHQTGRCTATQSALGPVYLRAESCSKTDQSGWGTPMRRPTTQGAFLCTNRYRGEIFDRMFVS